MGTKHKVLHPAYFTQFTCIGGACEANCCDAGWKITLSKKAYKQARNSRQAGFAQLITKNTKRLDETIVNGSDYGEIALIDERRCPFLCENGLCQLYIDFGPESLFPVCQMYPRQTSKFSPDMVEFSLAMSCPEAVRLALLKPEPITFELSEMELDPNGALGKIFSFKLPTPIPPNKPTAHIWGIREACIDIMQDKSGPLPERLMIIGMMLKKAADLQAAGKTTEMTAMASSFSKAAANGQFKGLQKSLKRNEELEITLQATLFGYILVKCMGDKGDKTPFHILIEDFLENYSKTHQEEFQKLPENDTIDIEIAVPMYQFVEGFASDLWPKLLSKYEQVLENYFVNYIFSQVFPFKYHEKLGVDQHFVILAEQYAMLRMLLCHAEVKGTLDEQRLIKILTSISHLDQHSQIVSHIIETYHKQGLDDLAHISFLLR